MKNKTASEIGSLGEEYAEKHLVKHKYRIVARNFRCKFGEIDIIAQNKEYIVFVEVKTRGNNAIAPPAAFVTKSKQGKILKTASFYLANNPSDLQPRFDIAEVTYSDKQATVNYIENAFIQEGDYAPF